jgi:hypothetical protein
MMLKLLMLATVALASAAVAQSPTPQTPLGRWDVEYERTILRMHGEPEQVRERGRMTLRTAGDSLFGDLALNDPDSTRVLLRGTARSNAWTLYVEEARPTGLSVLMVPLDMAMEWLKENVHGMQPVVVRFDLATRADSVTGTRTVTGGRAAKARTSTVRGVRRKP